ncbi:30S ribosomal protein S9 [Candidatus Daviesbacteria bacterium]|nr:30S ribosomal protein S9 [Candidatus Daviesbacteria bacterium]
MAQSSTNVVGRRKEAVARVRVTSGNGQITVNGKPVAEYFAGPVSQKKYLRPLEVSKLTGKYAISVIVSGGGQMSQLDATTFAIARGLVKASPDSRSALKKEGLLTRDARVKERRKYGNAQKARAKKQSPKR